MVLLGLGMGRRLHARHPGRDQRRLPTRRRGRRGGRQRRDAGRQLPRRRGPEQHRGRRHPRTTCSPATPEPRSSTATPPRPAGWPPPLAVVVILVVTGLTQRSASASEPARLDHDHGTERREQHDDRRAQPHDRPRHRQGRRRRGSSPRSSAWPRPTSYGPFRVLDARQRGVPRLRRRPRRAATAQHYAFLVGRRRSSTRSTQRIVDRGLHLLGRPVPPRARARSTPTTAAAASTGTAPDGHNLEIITVPYGG